MEKGEEKGKKTGPLNCRIERNRDTEQDFRQGM